MWDKLSAARLKGLANGDVNAELPNAPADEVTEPWKADFDAFGEALVCSPSLSTQSIEIQGENHLKTVAPPPPTPQTPGPNWLIFWLETPHVNSFRGIEAIFEFHSGS